MKILFVNLSALKFTVLTPDSAPLGGSESALCYLARVLARRGHDVALTANLPEGASGSIGSVRHYPLTAIRDAGFFAAEIFDILIICNAPAAAVPLKALSPASRIIFWAHVLPDQPSMQILRDPHARDSIDAVIFVSRWQQSEITRAFGSFRGEAVIGNGIAPAFENMFAAPEDILRAKQNRAAYTATPYRGLSVLVQAMRGLDRPTTLDLFSSMKLYQAGDEDYAPLFEEAARNPAITRHGVVTQAVLAQQLSAHAFLFYPCIYPETFCITAAEAMAAGMKIVSTQLGALEETTMGFADLVPVATRDGDQLAALFRAAMRKAIDEFTQDPAAWAQAMFAQSQRANERFNWEKRAAEWERVLADG